MCVCICTYTCMHVHIHVRKINMYAYVCVLLIVTCIAALCTGILPTAVPSSGHRTCQIGLPPFSIASSLNAITVHDTDERILVNIHVSRIA